MPETTTLLTALGAVIAAAGATAHGLAICPQILDQADDMLGRADHTARRNLAGGGDPPRRRKPRRLLRGICQACAMCQRGRC